MDDLAYPHFDPGKGFGKHECVPCLQHPGALHRQIKSSQGQLRVTRQKSWTRFGDIARAAWAINRKSHAAPGLEFRVHGQQTGCASASAGAAHRVKAQLLDDARNVFAIEAAAGHHSDIAIAITVASGKNAAVPEDINPGEDAFL